jgi:imidazolonepropionase-like amidohydrolase
MKRIVAPVVLLTSVALSVGCGRSGDTLVIRNATIIDGTGTAPRPRMTVIVERGRISEIGEAGRSRHPRSARVIDGTGKYLIPGLWDMHVHLRDLEGTLPLFVVNGVTSVRDMGSDFETTAALREQVESGVVWGPRIKTPGRMLESAAWLDQYVDLLRNQGFEEQAESFLQRRIRTDNPTESVQVVETLAASGVDFVKIRHAGRRSPIWPSPGPTTMPGSNWSVTTSGSSASSKRRTPDRTASSTTSTPDSTSGTLRRRQRSSRP